MPPRKPKPTAPWPAKQDRQPAPAKVPPSGAAPTAPAATAPTPEERRFTAGDVQAAVSRTLFSVAVTALAQGLVLLAECPGRVGEGGRCRLLRGHDGECLPVRPVVPPKTLLPETEG